MKSIHSLNIEREKLRIEAKKLTEEKNKLYFNVDISEPMSEHEKKLTKKIALIYSRINQIIKEKRKLT